MVELVGYTESWPAEFRRIAARLRKMLGPTAIRIDHIGSTSVPGLRAKDVLDIQVTVEAIDRVVETRVLAAGYRQPPGVWCDHRPPDATGPDEDWASCSSTSPPENGASICTCENSDVRINAIRCSFVTSSRLTLRWQPRTAS